MAKVNISLYSIGFLQQLQNLITNLLFLRFEFWGGQFCSDPIDLSRR